MTKKEALALLIQEVEAWIYDRADDPEYNKVRKAIKILEGGNN